MVRFLLLRHGKSENNGAQRHSGHYDTPLSEEGRIQAEKAARYLKENYAIDAIYSSDLSRAVDTVRPTAEAFGLEIVLRKDLRELDVGVFENRPFSEIRELYPVESEGYRYHNVRCPGGECFGDLGERAMKACEELASLHDGQTVLIATHGGWIRSVKCLMECGDILRIREFTGIKNASVSVVEFEKGCGRFVETSIAHYLE